MDQSDENPILETEAREEVENADDEVKKRSSRFVKPLVKEIAHTAKSLLGNVKDSASHVGSKVEKEVEKLVSDQWASLKNLGGKSQTPEPVLKTTEKATLSDKNVEEESSGTDKGVDQESCEQPEKSDSDENPRSGETQQPIVGVSAGTRTSWMNCCGLLDLLKRSDE